MQSHGGRGLSISHLSQVMVMTVMAVTSHSTVLLGKVKVPKLVTEFPTFYANQQLITM
jgi:hypothetical protein